MNGGLAAPPFAPLRSADPPAYAKDATQRVRVAIVAGRPRGVASATSALRPTKWGTPEKRTIARLFSCPNDRRWLGCGKTVAEKMGYKYQTEVTEHGHNGHPHKRLLIEGHCTPAEATRIAGNLGMNPPFAFEWRTAFDRDDGLPRLPAFPLDPRGDAVPRCRDDDICMPSVRFWAYRFHVLARPDGTETIAQWRDEIWEYIAGHPNPPGVFVSRLDPAAAHRLGYRWVRSVM
jgi:hypothetical protein